MMLILLFQVSPVLNETRLKNLE